MATFIKNLTIAKSLLHLTALGAMAFLGFLIWQNSDDFNTLTTLKKKGTIIECDIQRPPHQCSFDSELGTITLNANSSIESLIPFNMSLSLQSSHITSAKIRFEGFEDYMGINQFRYSAAADNQWLMNGSIPLCTTKSKTWRVILSLYNQNQYTSYWFKMKTP